jgi:hypothetical protein
MDRTLSHQLCLERKGAWCKDITGLGPRISKSRRSGTKGSGKEVSQWIHGSKHKTWVSLNAYQIEQTPEESQSNHIDKRTLPLDVSQPQHSITSTFSWTKQWAQQSRMLFLGPQDGHPLTRFILLLLLQSIWLIRKSNIKPLRWYQLSYQPASWWQIYYIRPLLSWKGLHFMLTGNDIVFPLFSYTQHNTLFSVTQYNF